MTKQFSTFFLMLFISVIAFGQSKLTKTESIDFYAYQIDTAKTQTDSFKVSLDSIQIDVRLNINRIATRNLFQKSKSVLKINYYFKDEDLVFISIAEQSPMFYDLNSYAFLYYNNGRLIDEKYRHNVRPCMVAPLDKTIYELYGYNPALNSEFLKKYVFVLLDKLIGMK